MEQPEREAVLHRSFTLFFTCAALLLWSPSSIAAPGELGDNGGNNTNPHNLSSLSGNAYKAVAQATPGKETQICIFCHTPHGATPQTTLWGRPDPTGPNGDGTFPLFTQGTLGIADSTIVDRSEYGQGEYPNGASKLCLSCHDGVTAMGVLSNGTEIEMTGNGLTTGAINLATSHPISFKYTADYLTELDTFRGSTYTLPTTIPLDDDNRVQCTICHEPHLDTNDGTYTLPFWRTAHKKPTQAEDYNAVCDECHVTNYYPGIDHTIP